VKEAQIANVKWGNYTRRLRINRGTTRGKSAGQKTGNALQNQTPKRNNLLVLINMGNNDKTQFGGDRKIKIRKIRWTNLCCGTPNGGSEYFLIGEKKPLKVILAVSLTEGLPWQVTRQGKNGAYPGDKGEQKPTAGVNDPYTKKSRKSP